MENWQRAMCLAPRRVAPSHWMAHLPFAFWLVEVARPRLIVELGSYYGVSFCAFCQQIERLGLACEAYAVDLWQGDGHMGQYGPEVYEDLAAHVAAHYPGFACLLKTSFDEALTQFRDGSVDLLHLDGSHTHEAILRDFENWLPKLSARGIVLIHDVNARFSGFGGVSAWAEIAPRFPSFAFYHGYGLGVVAAGPDAPVAILELCNIGSDELTAALRQFQEQGRIYEDYFALESRRREENRTWNARLKALEAQMVREREVMVKEREVVEADRAKERDAHRREAEQLAAALSESRAREQAYADSFSWKITKPLRKVLRAMGL